MDDMDFLVCGSCHLEFPLSDITLFMRHKRSDCTEGRENSVGDIIEHFQCYSCPVKFATALGLVLHAQTSHQLQIYYEGLNPTQDRETQNNQRTQQDKQVCRSQPKHNNTLKEAVNSDDSYHQLSLAGGAECHNQGSPYSNADLPEQHMRSSRPHGMSLQNSPSSSTVSTPIPSGGRGQWHEVQDTPEDLSLSPHRAPSSSLSLSHGHAHHQPCLSPNDYSILTATQETWLGNHGSKDDSMQNLSHYSRVAVVPKKRKWVSEDRYTSAGSEDEVKVTPRTNGETGLEHSDEACSAQNGFVVHNPLTIQVNQENGQQQQQQHSFRRECTKALEDTIRKHLNSDSLIREQLLRRTEHSANMYKMPELIEVAKAAPTDSTHLLSTGVSMDLQAPKLEMEAGVPMSSEDLWDCESRSSLQLNKKRRYPTTRPFKCDQCDHSFNQRIHLKKHLSKHTGIKPFKCNQCDYATVERSHLKVHIRIHTGEKPFKCLYCDYATAQNSTLKIHLKRHHAGTIITCETCGRNFTDKSDYELHALEHQQNGTPQKGLKPPGGENQHLPVVPSPHENSYPAGRVVVAES